METQKFVAYTWEDKFADEGDFVTSDTFIRYVYIASLDCNRGRVDFETPESERLSRRGVENGRISVPTAKEMFEREVSISATEFYDIPYTPIDASSLKCDCGLPCKVIISNRSNIKNREQAICPKPKPADRCKYRQWMDTAHIQCKCRIPADLTKASGINKPENKGKEYFRCRHSKKENHHTCEFFCWKSNLEGYLSNKNHMSVEDALQRMLRTYKSIPYDPESDISNGSKRFKFSSDVLSTLARKCRNNIEPISYNITYIR